MMRRWFTFALAILSFAATTGAQQPQPAPSSSADMLSVGISVRKLLWDSKRRQIIALVADPANVAEYGNLQILPSRIAIVDPVRGTVDGSILIGERPSDLAVDPDGAYLYSALWARGVVRRFRLADRAWDRDIPIAPDEKPASNNPPIRALAALPGKSGVLVVATATSCLVFDDETPRQVVANIRGIDSLHVRTDGTLSAHVLSGPTGQVVSLDIGGAGVRMAEKPAAFRAVGELIYGGNYAASKPCVVFDLERGVQLGAVSLGQVTSSCVPMLDPASKAFFAIPDADINTGKFRIVRYNLDHFGETADFRMEAGPGSGRPVMGLAWDGGIAVANGSKLFIVPARSFRDIPQLTLPAPRTSNDGIMRIALQASALAFDPKSKTLYVAVAANAAHYANAIVAVDLKTGKAGNSVWVGSESWPLNLSADGRVLYAGSKSAAVVNRIDTRTWKLDASLKPPVNALPASAVPFDWRARNIVMVPGKGHAAAVLWRSEAHSAIAVYDDAAQRPLAIPAEPRQSLALLFPGESRGTVLALGDERFENHTIQRLAITERGVAPQATLDPQDRLSSGYSWEQSGWLVDGNRVFQWTGAALRRVFTLDTFAFQESTPRYVAGNLVAGIKVGAAALDVAGQRTYYVAQEAGASPVAVAYDQRTYRPLAIARIDDVNPAGASISFDDRPSALVAASTLVVRTRQELLLLPLAAFKPWPALAAAVDELAPGLRRIRLPVNDIAGDSLHGKLLATVPGWLGPRGNSLLVIDPNTGNVEKAIFAGSNPSHIAVSNNGRSAFVALDGEARMARINLASASRDSVFDSTVSRLGTVADLVESPSGLLAAGYTDGSIVIFDKGRRREVQPPFSANRSSASRLAFDASETTLLAFGSRPVPFAVKPDEIVRVPTPQQPEIQTLFLANAQYSGGLLYMASGQIVDPLRTEVVGQFNVPLQYRTSNSAERGRIWLDAQKNRAYILAAGSSPRISVFDLKTRTLLAVRDLPIAAMTFLRLVSCGPDTLAIRTSDSILILHISTIPSIQ